MYAFIHYSLNTYTDQEWGFGNEDPKLFNPSDLDCRQWARVCKQAGMRGIIFTAKHHCGFCMWPSKYTEYSVKNSPWKDGKGDVVRELADACREEGLEFAVYLSPWDRNHPEYGRHAYVEYFRNQLRELLTNYGDIFEVWFDGANGGDGWYGGANETRKIDRTTYYEWPETYKMIRQLQPKCLIWNDGSDRGDLRWVGTEAGNVGETNWSLLYRDGDVPYQMLHYGVEDGNVWCPGETNTSIRPGWFYHPEEDSKVKTPEQLVDIFYKSVGRNATFLLNFPVDREGRVNAIDSANAVRFRQIIDAEFKTNLLRKAKVTASSERGKSFSAKKLNDGKWDTYWATPDGTTTGSVTFTFRKPTRVNRLLLQEYIPLGQRVGRFEAEALVDGKWTQIDPGEPFGNIGYKRILRFATIEATALRISFFDGRGPLCINNVAAYCAKEN